MLAVERWGRWRQPQHAPQLLVYDIGVLLPLRRLLWGVGISLQQHAWHPPLAAQCRSQAAHWHAISSTLSACPTLSTRIAVLERSTLGVPHSALPLLAAALLLLAAAAAAVPQWTDAAVPRLLSWLGGGRAAAAAGVSMPAAGSRGRRAAARAAAR